MKGNAKSMRLARLMLLLWPILGMLACSDNQTRLPPPLPPPIVNCDQATPSEPLPDYPKLHIRVAGETDGQYIIDLEADRTEAVKWAVVVAGITQRNAIRRNTTANCLDQLRKAGTIY